MKHFSQIFGKSTSAAPYASQKHITRYYLTGAALLLAVVVLGFAVRPNQIQLQQTGTDDTKLEGIEQPAAAPKQSAESVLGTEDKSMKVESGSASNDSETNVSIHSDGYSSEITVNGESHSVPPDTNSTQVYESENGNTRVEVSIQNSSSNPADDQRDRYRIRSDSSLNISSSTETNTRYRD